MASSAGLAMPGSKSSAPRPISLSRSRPSYDGNSSQSSVPQAMFSSECARSASSCTRRPSRGDTASLSTSGRRMQAGPGTTSTATPTPGLRTSGFACPTQPAMRSSSLSNSTSAVGLLRQQLSTPHESTDLLKLKTQLHRDLSNEHVSTIRGSAIWEAAKFRCESLQCPHIQRAYVIAAAAHAGQKRKDGSMVIQHLEETAIILADLGLDNATIAAALLHDCLDDSVMTHELLREHSTAEIADLVEQVSKVSSISQLYRSEASLRSDGMLDRLSTLLIAMGDVRVVLIKLADRLHNMRTLHALPLDKRRRMSLETAAIFVPLANRLGVWSMKADLEDLCLMHTEPEKFADLKGRVDATVMAQKHALDGFLADTTALLRSTRINALDMSGRKKSFSAIYHKLAKPSCDGGTCRDLGDIHDVLAMRVIVTSKTDCYLAMREITNRFHEQKGRYKDYIRTPKPNGYQSLHTVVYTNEGIPIEVQIRTDKMHFNAEYGVAAHWRYKEGGGAGEGGVAGEESDTNRVVWSRMFLAFGLKVRDNKIRPVGSAPREDFLQRMGGGLLEAATRSASARETPGLTECKPRRGGSSFEEFMRAGVSPPEEAAAVHIVTSSEVTTRVHRMPPNATLASVVGSAFPVATQISSLLVNGKPALGAAQPLRTGDIVCSCSSAAEPAYMSLGRATTWRPPQRLNLNSILDTMFTPQERAYSQRQIVH